MKLRPIAFMVYCYLKRCHNAENGCFPSKATIANECGIAESSVDKALKELQEAGIVSVQHRYGNGHQKSNLYKLRDIQKLWMNRDFLPAAMEEEAIREEETEQWVEEVLDF